MDLVLVYAAVSRSFSYSIFFVSGPSVNFVLYLQRDYPMWKYYRIALSLARISSHRYFCVSFMCYVRCTSLNWILIRVSANSCISQSNRIPIPSPCRYTNASGISQVFRKTLLPFGHSAWYITSFHELLPFSIFYPSPFFAISRPYNGRGFNPNTMSFEVVVKPVSV